MQQFRISGLVKFGSGNRPARRRDAGGLRPRRRRRRLFDKPGQFDEIDDRGASRGDTDKQLVSRGQRDPAAERAGAHRRGSRRTKDAKDTNSFITLPARLPARLRRHRALRRQLRDRQLALDHDRAANARVRDAAHARRDAPPGASFDLRRGARRSGRSRRSSGSSSASVLAKGLFGLFDAVGFTLPNSGIIVRDADRDRRRCSSASSSRSSRACGRRSARRAFRRSPPCARARRCRRRGFARFRTAGSTTVAVLGFAALALRAVRQRPRDDRRARLDGRRRAADLHRRLDALGPVRPAARRACSAGRRRGSAAPRARSRRTTRGGTRSGRRRRPLR